MLDARALIEKYKGKGVLVDTNLLVLHIVGSVNRRRIENFKRTQAFTVEDFDLLCNLMAWFGLPVLVTPHVLSQVSDLTDLSGFEKNSARERLSTLISVLDERYDDAKTLVRNPLFRQHGLADAGIAEVCKPNVLTLTSDLALYTALSLNGSDALNFNHVRALGWRI